MIPMPSNRLSAYQLMEARWSFIYFVVTFCFMSIAAIMLVLANVKPVAIIIPGFFCGICICFAWLVYYRKKQGRSPGIFPWISATIFVLLPLVSKITYVRVYGWEVALDSYNSSVLFIMTVIMTQFLYNRRLYQVVAVLSFCGWGGFLLAAFLSGAKMSLHSVMAGHSVHDFVVLRELFIMIAGMVICWAVYRIIPITSAYIAQATAHHHLIEEQNRLLEDRVQKRTKDLTEAKEKLIELNRVRTLFFTNISHEIRTPLTLILSPLEAWLQGEYRGNADRDFVAGLHRNALRLYHFINAILDVSRIESGRMELRVREIDIVSLLRIHVGCVESACASRNIRVRFKPAAEQLLLYLDREKMERVIMNLLSNAIKFTPPGGSIEVRIREEAGECVFEIEDTGVGIPANSLDAVFDRYAVSTESMNGSFAGTGIGLSLVREFVDMHGGRVDLASRYIEDDPAGHGTVITVRIPVGDGHLRSRAQVVFLQRDLPDGADPSYEDFLPDEIAPPAAGVVPGPVVLSESEAPRRRILVVDDNADMRQLLNTLLSRYYTILFAIHGEDGLRKARDERPDLIITDVMMPVMDGYEMTSRLKRDQALGRIPVIMLTAKSEVADRIEGLEYGVDDYLSKPFNARELLTRVRTLLDNFEYQRIIAQRNREVEIDLDTARLILQKLLPAEHPVIPGVESAVAYLPMDKVGGDFYDLRYREGALDILLADVCGHGLHAAFLSLITKISFDGIPSSDDPAAVLRHIDAVIEKTTVNRRFVTAFYGILDTTTMRMQYCSAGHCAPIVYRRHEDQLYELAVEARPLGWFVTKEFYDSEFQFEEGDRVLLYTDGVIECADRHERLFGVTALTAFIRETASLSPENCASQLTSRLREFAGAGGFQDDVTFIVLDIGATYSGGISPPPRTATR